MGPTEIFVSYAHADKQFVVDFVDHLKGGEYGGLVHTWFDPKLRGGDEWNAEIFRHLDAAHIVLVMVTEKLMGSRFCMNKEIPAALARRNHDEVVVMPLRVAPTPLAGSVLDGAGLQYIPGEPMRDHPRQSEVMAEVADEILARAAELRQQRRVTPLRATNMERQVKGFVARTDVMKELRQRFRATKDASRCQAIVGPSGVGKSAAAREFAWLHRADYRVMWWVRADDEAVMEGDFAALASALGVEAREQQTAIAAVRDYLAGNDDWLLVFDSAVRSDGILQLLPPLPLWGGDVLITSQHPVCEPWARTHELRWLSQEESAHYLNTQSGDYDEDAASQLAELLNGEPLALLQAATAVKSRMIRLARYLHEVRATAATGGGNA